MKTIEYRTVDKASWPRGPWDAEPDKKQWRDAATGLPCLIVRNGGGALCGYVGVVPNHPLHGKSYSEEVDPPATFKDRVFDDRTPMIPLFRRACRDGEDNGKVSVDLALDVHGGITFAGGCRDTSEDEWRRFQSRLVECRAEADRYPQGDAAEFIHTWGKACESYDAWLTMARSKFICHTPGVGEADGVWWFGFDCAHSGDRSPAYERIREMSAFRDGVYRDIAYVEREVASLAKQLFGWGAR